MLARNAVKVHIATFLRLPKLAAALETVPAGSELHVHFEQLSYIDHACLDLLIGWEKQHEATGGRLTIDWDSLTARFHSPPFRARRSRSGEQSTGQCACPMAPSGPVSHPRAPAWARVRAPPPQ